MILDVFFVCRFWLGCGFGSFGGLVLVEYDSERYLVFITRLLVGSDFRSSGKVEVV